MRTIPRSTSTLCHWGGWSKFRNLGEHRSTIATWLDANGYQTGLFGKYMNNYRDRLIPPGWDRWYAWNGVNEGWSSSQRSRSPRIAGPKAGRRSGCQGARSFSRRRLSNSAPVFSFVNFGAMHEPYYYSKVDDKKFRGVGVPRTRVFNEDDVSDKNVGIRA